MYLHGACRDSGTHDPQLRLREDTDTDHDGVGVTVNRYLENANWIAMIRLSSPELINTLGR
jgi:hypothetical protein